MSHSAPKAGNVPTARSVNIVGNRFNAINNKRSFRTHRRAHRADREVVMNAAFAWCRAACHFGSSLLAQLALTGWAWSLPPAAVAADFAVNGYSLNGGNNSVLATAVDATGNSVVAGIFNGDTATFGSISLPRIGNQDAFVVKRDASGTVLWAKNFGGIGADAYGQGIALDGSGNVFLGGSFYNSNLTTPALSKIGVNDAFAVKLDSNGNTVWSKNFGGSGASAVGLSIAVDGGGNVALSGYFDNANLTTPALTKIGISDAFAFKLDSSGVHFPQLRGPFF